MKILYVAVHAYKEVFGSQVGGEDTEKDKNHIGAHN